MTVITLWQRRKLKVYYFSYKCCYFRQCSTNAVGCTAIMVRNIITLFLCTIRNRVYYLATGSSTFMFVHRYIREYIYVKVFILCLHVYTYIYHKANLKRTWQSFLTFNLVNLQLRSTNGPFMDSRTLAQCWPSIIGHIYILTAKLVFQSV